MLHNWAKYGTWWGKLHSPLKIKAFAPCRTRLLRVSLSWEKGSKCYLFLFTIAGQNSILWSKCTHLSGGRNYLQDTRQRTCCCWCKLSVAAVAAAAAAAACGFCCCINATPSWTIRECSQSSSRSLFRSKRPPPNLYSCFILRMFVVDNNMTLHSLPRLLRRLRYLR